MPLSAVSAGPSLAQAFVAAAEVVGRVLDGESLNTALGDLKHRAPWQAVIAAAQDLCYNALRGYGVVDVALDRLLERPLTDSRLRGLLLAAFAELAARPQAAHAVVHQAVEAAVLLGHSRAKGLVNAVLRNFQRRMHQLLPEIEATEPGRYRHPQWWIDALRAAHPHGWEAALLDSNRHPPMVLRVNRRRLPASAYLEKLDRAAIPARALGEEAVLLEKPCRVERLPGFAAGEVSVQDAGGQRARRIAENLSRLGLTAKIVVGDCRDPESFSEGRTFDRILLDAPCSASGVVRRHPDIRWLRRRADASGFAGTQAQLLEALWRVLAADGKLLYATCSVFPEENGGQVRAFLTRHPEAELLPIPGLDDGQILPGAHSDGFFYALLTKGRPPT